MQDVADTNEIKKRLNDSYPGLQQINYQIAVDQVTIQENQLLTDGMTVALMPPFSGG